MPVQLTETQKSEYGGFLTGIGEYRLPSRNGRFNVFENYFSNIYHSRQALTQLLTGVDLPTGNDNIWKLILTAHAQVDKVPGQPMDSKMLIGQSDMPLSESGLVHATKQNGDSNGLVICSDTGRAVQHALAKYNRLDLWGDLTERILADHKSGGWTTPKTHSAIVEAALKAGIIPTPLLRSHYHAGRDLHPETKFDINAFSNSELGQKLYEGVSEGQMKFLLEYFSDLSNTGRSPFQIVQDGKGKILSEDMPLYLHRISNLLSLFGEYIRVAGTTVNLVGHSSNLDVVQAYFRHFNNPTQIVVEKADKRLTRGKEIELVLEGTDNYLNDTNLLDPLRRNALAEADKLTKHSVDEHIDNGLIKPYFQENKIVTLEAMVTNERPVLVLGHMGQGKTMLALQLINNMLSMDLLYADKPVVPVYLDSEQLNIALTDPFRNGNGGNLFPRVDEILTQYNQIVYIIDDLHKLNPTAYEKVVEQIKSSSQEGYKTIALSRYPQADKARLEQTFDVVKLGDPSSRQIRQYAEQRLTEDEYGEFAKYIGNYQNTEVSSMLTLALILKIYQQRDQLTDLPIENADTLSRIQKGHPLSSYQLMDVYTSMVVAKDLIRQGYKGTGLVREINQVRDSLGNILIRGG